MAKARFCKALFNFISGLFIDLSLLVGIVLFVMSFTQKFRKHKSKMLITGLALIAVGLVFLDTSVLSEAYQKGFEWGKNN